ncbi:response regulator [Pseudoalteromonas sp. R3]|jgi:two-component system OmpR family response regulator/two-component system response regulator QseB|uniref:response regulator n=1 Tax=Pseudoalteromonas sp. R3 TaxID=1709477 RepID=UPI0006B59E55|nr:response regulator [Pseudoalteromonas sp. R3]AZZ96347.1 response regulator [Pseudoalteromonas sp. R3]
MRLLLVEDDALLAQGLIQSLKREGYAVEHADTCAKALAAIEAMIPEMVVLDLGLPDGDGLTVLKALKREKAQVGVLILTARDELDDKISGLDHGADDYLAKPFEPLELFARLRVVARRFGKQQDSRLSCEQVVLDLASHQVEIEQSTLQLPRKEYMLLKALMENKGRVLSKNQLEDKLYHWGEELGSNAIEVHIHHLRKKLPDGFIKTLRGIGYVVGS